MFLNCIRSTTLLFLLFCTAQTCCGQKHCSPLPLTKIEGQFEQESPQLEGAVSCDPLEELKSLQNLQQSWIESIPRVRGAAWGNQIGTRGEFGTLYLTEFSVDFENQKQKQVHWNPKFDLVGADKTFEAKRKDDLATVLVFIVTDQMFIQGLGYRRQGIDTLKIDLPTSSGTSSMGFDVFGTVWPTMKTLAKFQESMRSMIGNKKQLEFVGRKTKKLLEFRAYPTNGNEDFCRRWIFDIEKGGVCTFYEDKIVPRSATEITTQYREAEGIFVPQKSRKTIFHRDNKTIDRIAETSFFEFSIVEEWDEDEFSLASLPIDPKLKIKDVRKGRNQMRKTADLIKEGK